MSATKKKAVKKVTTPTTQMREVSAFLKVVDIYLEADGITAEAVCERTGRGIWAAGVAYFGVRKLTLAQPDHGKVVNGVQC